MENQRRYLCHVCEKVFIQEDIILVMRSGNLEKGEPSFYLCGPCTDRFYTPEKGVKEDGSN